METYKSIPNIDNRDRIYSSVCFWVVNRLIKDGKLITCSIQSSAERTVYAAKGGDDVVRYKNSFFKLYPVCDFENILRMAQAKEIFFSNNESYDCESPEFTTVAAPFIFENEPYEGL